MINNIPNELLKDISVDVNGVGRTIDINNPGSSGDGWRFDSEKNEIIIFKPNDYTLEGSTGTNSVIIESTSGQQIFNIIFNQISINHNAENKCAFSIEDSANCIIHIYGNNRLSSGKNKSALNVTSKAKVELKKLIDLPSIAANLNIQGGENSGALGANYNEDFGSITINGGNYDISCKGGWGSSGIGYESSSYYSTSQSQSTVKIIDGNIKINTHFYSYNYSNDNLNGICSDIIEILGGSLYIKTYGRDASGICFKRNNSQNYLLIDGDPEVTAIASGVASAINPFPNGTITINSGNINAISIDDGAGIGSGYYWGGYDNCTITINGGIVNAEGSGNCAGIGTHNSQWMSNVHNFKIIINGGSIISKGGQWGGPGIGGGNRESYEKVDVSISSDASVIAIGGEGSYDIGRGRPQNWYGITYVSSGVPMAIGDPFNFSGLYAGDVEGAYLGKYSGMFNGYNKNTQKKIEGTFHGNSSGKIKGYYSGMFSGNYSGTLDPNPQLNQ